MGERRREEKRAHAAEVEEDGDREVERRERRRAEEIVEEARERPDRAETVREPRDEPRQREHAAHLSAAVSHLWVLQLRRHSTPHALYEYTTYPYACKLHDN